MATAQHLDRCMETRNQFANVKAVDPTIQVTTAEVDVVSDRDSVSEGSMSTTAGFVAANPEHAQEELSDGDTNGVAVKIFKIISSYGLAHERESMLEDLLSSNLPTISQSISRNEPIRLLLPGCEKSPQQGAFWYRFVKCDPVPYKSPNATDKVLGVLPDLGEELALAHLNGLCENVAAIYKHGAQVHIVSDGLVYNDLLGVPDATVWTYGQAVRQIANDREFRHLKFLRLWQILDHPGTWDEEYYVAHASCIRRELMYRYRDAAFEAELASKSDADMNSLHKQYLEFLRLDLAYSETHQALADDEKTTSINKIAKTMMARWKAYGAALADNCRGYVRLSIHDASSSRQSNKFSITLVPQDKGIFGHTPWHSCIAVELDGTYRTVHPSAVRDTHTLVYRNGNPSFYRAKSPLFDWTDSGLNVTFTHLYPQGLIIRPVTSGESNPSPPITALPMRKIRELSHTFSPVVLRGFSRTTEKDLFQASAYNLGEVLTWPQYGIMAVVKDAGNDSKLANNVTSNEAMPMHFDGIFKYKDVPDPTAEEPDRVKKVLNPPGHQYFTCIATAPKGSGYTLFASSRLFWKYLSSPWSVERLEKVTWGTLNTGFWKLTQEGLALVVRHPVTKEPCLRWHEPWSKTKYSTCKLIIENEDEALIEAVNSLLYDSRVCLRFSWERGDLLVNDNVSMLHTRTAYEGGCDREMWRIHFD